ncbi:MAG: gliding motility-associated protein GldE [Bacteroidetes bacterium]|nr:gliding motility-associated protein GldE [Bacteroidota bacterium]
MDDTGPVGVLAVSSVFRSLDGAAISSLLLLGLFMLICLLLSAICSSAENAFFSHRESDLEVLRGSKQTTSRNIIYLLTYPKHLLATILVVNSLSIVSFVVLSTFFMHTLLDIENHPVLRFFIEAIVVTLLILIFGEVMPKVYATQHYKKSAAFLSYPMRVFMFLFWPFTNLLVRVTGFLEKRVKQKAPELTPEELSHAIDIAADKEDAEQEKEILKGIVNIGQTQVSQIMRSRMDVAAIDDSLNYHEVLQEIRKHRFSRMPVYHEKFDNITGVLHMKDIMPYLAENADFNWQKFQRQAFFVPENKMIDDLLHEFRVSRTHLAVVVDEYGGCNGIVTLEDILEEVFGEMQDEFDDETQQYSRLDEDTYLFEAKVPLVDFLRIVHLPVTFFDEVNQETDTLGGLVTEIAGKIPIQGEEINYKNLSFYIDAADIRKITRVKIKIQKQTESND